MHRSIRSFKKPPSRTTHGHLTDVRAREGGGFDQKGLFVGGKLKPCPGWGGALGTEVRI